MSISEAAVEADGIGIRLRLMGREAFLALRYNPQALHIVDPVGDLRHKGVLDVPQLLISLFSFCRIDMFSNSKLCRALLTCIPDPTQVN